ncbi:alpha-amylase family protein [Paenibacillus sacheonensis]|uniref:Beta-galactosidase n=1 Tax=Paenibacillus sacheonensis TaxID=742054 RepID=A0A7X5C298_9BACL|nr:alpha-amylase family protein [Paenibacillus sacheonensis]NBC70114.1 beta-galactosidase [Paenibacillus sacheonensis]
MRFRQVHLDFHTSEAIGRIGSRFSKEQFQSMLREGRVDSITVFSKCHHGWAYHPSKANETHPELTFDLLGAMIGAAHEIDVNVPVYISAGLDEKVTRRHPEWLIRGKNESTTWAKDFMTPGYHRLCMNTPYLDVLVAQIEEVAQNYDADGIFLDIVGVVPCYCQSCVAAIRAEGGDPRDDDAMLNLWERTYANYAARTNEAVHKHKPGLPVFHNGGHIRRGRRDLAHFNTHLELESLPTGGWGYDHFPLSARYAQTLGLDYLGMTGKFHTSWGEFGGYKHPNALRYETALSIANGARCSIGDQLHPEGLMDEATYALIGAAYSELEAKEAWCSGVKAFSDIALLSNEALHPNTDEAHGSTSGKSDTGAVRMLLEGKFLFDVVDLEADFGAYKVLILPDHVRIDGPLQGKIAAFLQGGGKLLASGESGLRLDGGPGSDGKDAGAGAASGTGTRAAAASAQSRPDASSVDTAAALGGFAWDLGASHVGPSAYKPSFFRPEFSIAGLPAASFVTYADAQEVELANGGLSLGARENSYFNRDIFTFCSHQHTPSTGQQAGPGITEGRDGIYIAWNVFEDYASKGSLALKETVVYALNRLLPEKTLTTSLPAQGIVTLQKQEEQDRWVQHLLYAAPVTRGENIQIIEDLTPIRNTAVTVRADRPVQAAYLAPSGEPLPFEQADGVVGYVVPEFTCHAMVVLQF